MLAKSPRSFDTTDSTVCSPQTLSRRQKGFTSVELLLILIIIFLLIFLYLQTRGSNQVVCPQIPPAPACPACPAAPACPAIPACPAAPACPVINFCGDCGTDTEPEPEPEPETGMISSEKMPLGGYAITQLVEKAPTGSGDAIVDKGLNMIRKAALRDTDSEYCQNLKGVFVKMTWKAYEATPSNPYDATTPAIYNDSMIDGWVTEIDNWDAAGDCDLKFGVMFFPNNFYRLTNPDPSKINIPRRYRIDPAYGGGAGWHGMHQKCVINPDGVLQYRGFSLALGRGDSTPSEPKIRDRFNEMIAHLIDYMDENHPERFAGILFWETAHALKNATKIEDYNPPSLRPTLPDDCTGDYDIDTHFDGYEAGLKSAQTQIADRGYGLFSMYNYASGSGTKKRRAKHIKFLLEEKIGLGGPDSSPTGGNVNNYDKELSVSFEGSPVYYAQQTAKREYKYKIPTLAMFQANSTGDGATKTTGPRVYSYEDLLNFVRRHKPGFSPNFEIPPSAADHILDPTIVGDSENDRKYSNEPLGVPYVFMTARTDPDGPPDTTNWWTQGSAEWGDWITWDSPDDWNSSGDFDSWYSP